MKTTFSRPFFTTVVILLLALILVGTSFQVLVEDYLAESAIEELKQTSQAMANLASAYSAEGPMMNRDFMVNLDVTAQISGTDLIDPQRNDRSARAHNIAVARTTDLGLFGRDGTGFGDDDLFHHCFGGSHRVDRIRCFVGRKTNNVFYTGFNGGR